MVRESSGPPLGGDGMAVAPRAEQQRKRHHNAISVAPSGMGWLNSLSANAVGVTKAMVS